MSSGGEGYEEEYWSGSENEEGEEYNDKDVEEAIRMSNENKPGFRKYWMLTREEACVEMRRILTETSVVALVPSEICRVLLTKYNWNPSLFLKDYHNLTSAQFYNKNGLTALGNTLTSLDPEKLFGLESAEGEPTLIDCLVCLSKVDVAETAKDLCGHAVCIQCWRHYIKVQVEEKGFDCISCPMCPNIIREQILRELGTCESILKKLTDCQIRKFVETNSHMTWCPGVNCTDTVIKVESNKWSPSPIICLKCQIEFCMGCKADWHGPLPCHLITVWNMRIPPFPDINEEEETRRSLIWMGANTKNCPKCEVKIERSGGCNAVRCSKCAYSFCWICLGPEHTHSMENYCSKLHPQQINKINEEPVPKDEVLAMERFVFYSDRYSSHIKSLELEENLRIKTTKVLQEAVLKYGTAIISLETVGIAEAVKSLRRSRRLLAFSYAFLYFLRTDTEHTKNAQALYQTNLQSLHVCTENLSALLENFHTALKPQPKEFEERRVEVIRKAQNCDSCRKNLNSHVYEGYDQGIWKFQ